ncbi:MAG: FAD-dependent oxidoreductase, partial [Oscillospiraceae bacterium]|nr:FAD-dependent oxidoreductase [Oscillospiraceae bacterium]
HTGSAATVIDGVEIYGPQDELVSGPFGGPPVKVTGLTRDKMDEIIAKHVSAARQVKEYGFGMIMLHGAHGFLIHQFMSPTLNHRTDEYGGTFENRMRFPLEIVRAVREAVGPGFPIEMRISGSEVYEGGYGIEYGCQIAEALDGIVDLIHVSAGSHEDARVFTVTHPSMFLEDGVNVKYAAEVKKHVKISKVATVGALSNPALLEEIIASGKADVVEMGRGILCDPDLPNKAREGRDDEIVHCMRCLTCFSSLIRRGQIVCALNTEIENASERKFAPPDTSPKKVLVAGGGIAGMEAAITCADRGHEVILCEKSSRLGGVLLCEDKVPFKKHLGEYLDQQAKKIANRRIKVLLNTEATPELAAELAPDVIIAALGSTPLIPDIKGITGANVIGAVDVYKSPEKVGKKAVILGGGLVGAELAIYLGSLGHDVTIVEMMQSYNIGYNFLHGMAIGIEIDALGINTAFGTKVVEIDEKGVVGEGPDGKKLFEADTVINALGMVPMRDAAEPLRFCAPAFHQVGDCLSVKNVYEATSAAHQIAMDI